MLVTFVIVQFAPGGPVERVLAVLSGADTGAGSRVPGGSQGGDFGTRGQPGAGQLDGGASAKYRGAQGLDPKFIESLERQFGFDKPAHERFFLMLWNYIRFDFGRSYFRDVTVLELIKEKLPVSISLGIWLTLLSYLISIPLGIRKAVKDGSRLRRVDIGRHHCRLRAAGVPGRGAVDRPVRRRIVLRLVPAARAHVRELRVHAVVATDPRLSLAHGAADHLARACRLRHHDAADQELVPRRDPQAIRPHRARQGLQRAAGPLRACVPQRDADRHLRISGGVRARVLHRRAADRGDLFA